MDDDGNLEMVNAKMAVEFNHLFEEVCELIVPADWVSFDEPVLVPEGTSHSATSPFPQLEKMEPRL